jgi:hypothetical protein
MEFLAEVNGKIYEISELIKSVAYTDKLNDGCGKLEFSYHNDDLAINNGSVVRFKYNSTDTFYGYVFKHGAKKGKEIPVTAYDQLRYCKAKDTIIVKDDTITTLTKKMCNYFSLKAGILTDTAYKLATSVQDDKTWLDIIYSAINETLINKGKWYALRDEFGGIALRDLEELQLDLVLGDKSLCYDYDYEKSIDDDFYNQIKLEIDSETSGKREIYIAKDSSSIKKYGLLQYFEVLDKKTNAVQAKSKADMLLSLYNREVESISMECLGDTRIRAGVGIYGTIADIALNKNLIVRSVTHKYLPVHTMTVEVAL